MKLLVATTAMLAVGILGSAFGADLDMTYDMENTDYLRFEPVLATVHVRNNTSQPVRIGDTGADATIQFFVGRTQYEPMKRMNTDVMVEETTVQPGEDRELIVDLSSAFDMREERKYLSCARIEFGGRMIESVWRTVDIVNGIEILKKSERMGGDKGETMNYSLRYWRRGKLAEHLFLRVDDEAGKRNFGVFDLGPVVRVAKPTVEVDIAKDVMVVHQVGMGQFMRSTFRWTLGRIRFIRQTPIDEALSSDIEERYIEDRTTTDEKE